MIKVFVVLFFTLLITVPLTFLVVGPVANTFSNGLTNLFQAIMNFNPIVFGLVLGVLWQVLVMFGMHWALVPLAILDVATNGSSIILSAAILPCFTQTGVLGAIMLKTKEEKVRTISMPAFISSIFGVTEPAIYGVTLPMKTPFYISCGVSGLMGAAMIALDIKAYSIGGLGVFVFPSLIGPDGNLSKVIFAIIIAIVVVFLPSSSNSLYEYQIYTVVDQLRVKKKLRKLHLLLKKFNKKSLLAHLLGILSHLTKFLTKSLPQELWVKELLLTLLMG